jgi:hypothetical protein
MLTRLVRSVLVALLLTVVVTGQEKLTLTTPVFTSAGASEFRLGLLLLVRQTASGQESHIRAVFAEVTPGTTTFIPGGRTLVCEYEGAVADSMIVLLNKANLTANSLERRVTTTCQTDGKLGPGTISGTPQ